MGKHDYKNHEDKVTQLNSDRSANKITSLAVVRMTVRVCDAFGGRVAQGTRKKVYIISLREKQNKIKGGETSSISQGRETSS